MDGKSGFLVGSGGFVWTERGLLKAGEITENDKVLGIGSDGRHSWSSLKKIKTRKCKLIQLTTDSSETLLSKDSEIYTVEGIRKISSVNNDVLIETANIPSEVVDRLNGNLPLFSIDIGERKIEINEKISYLMGAQVRAKRYSDKIVFDHLETDKAHVVASICGEVRKTSGGDKIYYVAGGRRVRFDSTILACACKDLWKDYNILCAIRHSRPSIILSFASGVLDMILQKNSHENPPNYFVTDEQVSEFRRFLLNSIRLSGVIPAKMHTAAHQDGSIFFRCSVNSADLARLGLNFIRGIANPLGFQEIKPISYSSVKHISSVQGKLLYLSTEEPHWSPIVDLLPLHRQMF